MELMDIDASVVVKWVFPEAEGEDDAELALSLLAEVKAGRLNPLQPPHWLAEVAAVVTRLRPEIADSVLDLLDAMELPVVNDTGDAANERAGSPAGSRPPSRTTSIMP